MEVVPLEILGAYLVKYEKISDDRGAFVKTFNREMLSQFDALFGFSVEEEFYSSSIKGVLRGMHFQIPPFDHDKLVYCIQGRVLDAFIDLRRSSATYGKSMCIELDSNDPSAVFLPKGLAHGFYTVSESATLVYKTNCKYSPSHDKGVLWSSCGVKWPNLDPKISKRDAAFPHLDKFGSPFK